MTPTGTLDRHQHPSSWEKKVFWGPCGSGSLLDLTARVRGPGPCTDLASRAPHGRIAEQLQREVLCLGITAYKFSVDCLYISR